MASRAILRAVSTPIVISEPYRSLSIVDATPTTGKPRLDSSQLPACEPFPPMTTRASMPASFIALILRICPSSVLNSGQRALPRIVPPLCSTPPTSRGPSSWNFPLMRPSYPPRTPYTSHPNDRPVRVTARIAAFIPGASPPLVRTAILFISASHHTNSYNFSINTFLKSRTL